MEINRLSREISTTDAENQIKEILNREFPDEIVSLYVVPNLTQRYIAYQKLENSKDKLDHYLEILRQKDIRKKFRPQLCGPMVDAVKYYEKLTEKLEKEYQEVFSKRVSGNAGIAYVSFRKTASVEKARL